MERLAKSNINTSEEYSSIYFQRKEKGVDEFDLKRWNLLLRYYKHGRFVDLGCLDSLAPILAKERSPNSEVWALDHAKEALDDMKELYPQVLWQIGDVYKTRFPGLYFQYAIAGELIEHLEKPEKFLEEAFRILKKGGILALSTPLEEKLGEVDAERHLWSYSIDDIRKLLEPYGSVKIKLFPLMHIPFSQYHHKNIIAYTTKK